MTFTNLLLLALPVACVSWTLAETELFRDLREWLKGWACKRPNSWLCQKAAYVLTCYYCTSHYVAALALWMHPLPLFGEGWRNFVLTWFSTVGISAVYLTVFNVGRVKLRFYRAQADHEATKLGVRNDRERD